MMGAITGATTDVCLGGISGPAITTARRFGRIARGIHPLASGLVANIGSPDATPSPSARDPSGAENRPDNGALREMAPRTG